MKFKRLAFVLFLAAVLAAFLRTFVFETIRVVTPAMSQSQPVGNRLIVEKWTLGARLPLSIGIPFAPDALLGINTYFRTLRKPYRFLGFSTLRRNDLVAFNSPMTDDKPVDRHPILLSRCIGLPGEYIRVQGPAIFINDEEIQRPVDVSNCYRYPVSRQKNILELLKSCNIQQKTYLEKDSGYVYLTRYEYSTLSRRPEADSLGLMPYASGFDQKTAVIPYKGYRIELNTRSFRIWGDLINRYEGVRLVQTETGLYRKNGKEAEYYLFKQNYYWLQNDHQGYVDDSRSFGLIPEDYLIGKAWLVVFSPATKRFMQKI